MRYFADDNMYDAATGWWRAGCGIKAGPKSATSDFGKQSTNFYTANPPSRYIHHFSWHFTCRQLCFFFSQANIQTPSFCRQQPCYVISALILCSLLLLRPLISQFSLLLQNPKSTRSCQWRRQKEEVGWALASVRQPNAEGVMSEAPQAPRRAPKARGSRRHRRRGG